MPYTRRHSGPAPELHRAPKNRFRAAVRDTLVLLREFRGALLLFLVTLLAGGFLWMVFTNFTQDEPIGYVESLYMVLRLVFFQADEAFPDEWYRDIFLFLMPVLGLAILGRGAADFAVLLFNRQARQAQWEVALASTYNRHIIVCGLGHVGIRVVRELVSLGEDSVVVVDIDPEVARAEECRSYGIPLIEGDGKRPKTLTEAGIENAEAFIVCTNDDLLNLQIGLNARELNPRMRLVMRMFDDVLGRQLAEQLGIENVFSASALAAPSFAGAAIGTSVTQTFYVEDEVMNMTRLRVQSGSALDGMTMGQLEHARDMSVVLHQSNTTVDLHPDHDARLQAGDLIVIFSNLSGLSEIRRMNRAAGEAIPTGEVSRPSKRKLMGGVRGLLRRDKGRSSGS